VRICLFVGDDNLLAARAREEAPDERSRVGDGFRVGRFKSFPHAIRGQTRGNARDDIVKRLIAAQQELQRAVVLEQVAQGRERLGARVFERVVHLRLFALDWIRLDCIG